MLYGLCCSIKYQPFRIFQKDRPFLALPFIRETQLTYPFLTYFISKVTTRWVATSSICYGEIFYFYFFIFAPRSFKIIYLFSASINNFKTDLTKKIALSLLSAVTSSLTFMLENPTPFAKLPPVTVPVKVSAFAF